MATQLPHLPDIQRLSPRVIRILGANPGKFTLQGTNTYLLGTGTSRFLIDTGEGVPAWRSRLSTVLENENATVSCAFLTHWHQDHVNGVADLKALCPGLKIYKHVEDGGLYGERTPGQGEKKEEQTAHAVEDGQVFSTDGASLVAIFCPGHTTDHTAFFLKEEEALFTGDNVLGHGTAVFENLGTYMASLGKMRDRAASGRRVYPAHGAVIEDGRAKIEEYIRHRKQREEQVLAVLTHWEEGEGVTPMEIVKVVYKEYPESVHQAACGGVMQILKKLQGEGKVANREKDLWTVMDARAARSTSTL